ncbi:MAG: DUF924 domain-containing protein [Proteobacteria bacterium]|nr:DUF924 domain-containing protein [Pseudomonadota bacterium]
MQRAEEINKFWLGRVEQTIIPSEHRARVWFGEDPETDAEIKRLFGADLQKAINSEYDLWQNSPRGQLALILLLDQFSRHIYRDTIQAFAQDNKALAICLQGISVEADHALSLIERVFYYFPLLHSENLHHQEQAVRSYQILSELAFAETRVIYDSFLRFANHHLGIIQRFSRFPQRNKVLGRESTPEELVYLREIEASME